MSDKTKGFIQLFFVILFIAGSFGVSALLGAIKPDVGKSVNSERTLFVETKDISPTTYRIEFDTTGTVETRGTVNIVPEVSGRIISVSDQFFEGGMFEAGEILFQIEPLDFELEVRRLEAEVARANTSLDLAKAEAKASLSEWQQINGNKAAPDLVARKPQLQEARANLKAAQAQLEDARLNLDRASFSLPFNGRVLNSSLEAGQYVMAGQSYGQVFGLETLEVISSLDGQKLEWLLDAPNPEITISANYLGKTLTYEGYLKRSASSLDAQTRFATVSFGFKEKNVALLPGIFAEVQVTGSNLKDIYVFPSQALQKQGIIWLVQDDKTLTAYEPDIIYASDKYIVTRSNGDTMKTVINKLAGATEGTKVEVNNESNDEAEKPNDMLEDPPSDDI